MYSKIIFFVALNFIAVFAQNICDCSDDKIEQSIKESNDIVGFLNQLAVKDIPDEEKYPMVPPNVITGMLACDCKENFRRKRRIIKEDITEKPSLILTPVTEKPSMKPSRLLSKRNCPKGFSRIGAICMSQSHLL